MSDEMNLNNLPTPENTPPAAPPTDPLFHTPPTYAQPPYGMPTPPQTPQKGKGLAIASLVLGILSLCCFCICGFNLILGLVGTVLSIIALCQNNRSGLAIAGIITSVIGLVLALIVTFSTLLSDNFKIGFSQGFNEGMEDFYEDFYEDFEEFDADSHSNFL